MAEEQRSSRNSVADLIERINNSGDSEGISFSVAAECVVKAYERGRAAVSERGTPVAWRTTSGAIFTDKRRVTEFDTPLFERKET